jgi:hypothetical protein
MLVHVGEKLNQKHVYMFLVLKPEGKRSLGRSICTWEENIVINFKEL